MAARFKCPDCGAESHWDGVCQSCKACNVVPNTTTDELIETEEVQPTEIEEGSPTRPDESDSSPIDTEGLVATYEEIEPIIEPKTSEYSVSFSIGGRANKVPIKDPIETQPMPEPVPIEVHVPDCADTDREKLLTEQYETLSPEEEDHSPEVTWKACLICFLLPFVGQTFFAMFGGERMGNSIRLSLCTLLGAFIWAKVFFMF